MTNMSVPGFKINSVPQNPIITLNHLRIPTDSFRKITEKITTINGPVWKIVIVDTRVKYLKPRLGERYASALTNMSLNNKVIKKYGKISLKDYISSFIKNQKK